MRAQRKKNKICIFKVQWCACERQQENLLMRKMDWKCLWKCIWKVENWNTLLVPCSSHTNSILKLKGACLVFADLPRVPAECVCSPVQQPDETECDAEHRLHQARHCELQHTVLALFLPSSSRLRIVTTTPGPNLMWFYWSIEYAQQTVRR